MDTSTYTAEGTEIKKTQHSSGKSVFFLEPFEIPCGLC